MTTRLPSQPLRGLTCPCCGDIAPDAGIVANPNDMTGWCGGCSDYGCAACDDCQELDLDCVGCPECAAWGSHPCSLDSASWPLTTDQAVAVAEMVARRPQPGQAAMFLDAP